ncbi:MAG: deoxyribodipyrimidine photo-lyase [Polyangiaceae bacterium]|nr:deoxyribodipyrimidine photo-lyase [Polyangiaceae bacterium]
MRTVVWFRGKDLRISDHAPLRAAVSAGEALPLFVLDPYFFAPARARQLPHRIQFLLESLAALEGNLRSRGSRLVLIEGKSVDIVPRLVESCKVDRVVAYSWVAPIGRERDRRIGEALGDRFELFEGETLQPPGTLRSGSGRPYSVFSAFSRAWLRTFAPGKPFAAPRSLPPVTGDILEQSVPMPSCEDLGIAPNPRLQRGGERAAHERLHAFLRGPAADYAEQRDRMDLDGTSRLSADLKFGTLSVRQVWAAVGETLGDTPSARAFQNELIWREFTHSSLYDRPELLQVPFHSDFQGFPWRKDEEAWEAWVAGKTGYPVVDAAARQLLAEGFVHNRARMISASFLTKHLMMEYRRGESHYMQYLTDGDWAQNNAGWQWSAGCGCDAQPYFRVFNPTTQGQKFDPNGAYVRRWVSELAKMPTKYIHSPWNAPDTILGDAGVCLGDNYPRPIVDHQQARQRYLDVAGAHLKGGRQ